MRDHFLPEPSYQHGQPNKTGILLINLGTPDAPTKAALKPYLKAFLSDRRIVELPSWLWQPLLRGVILQTRPAKSAAKYAQIWTRDGSPLQLHTERLAKQLKGTLGERGQRQLEVAYGMRYGNPSIETALMALKQKGCDRILLVPLYPQYAASSTASALDAAYSVLQRIRHQPEIRVIKHFHDAPPYIRALASLIRDYWAQHGRPVKLLFSFHGTPKFSLDRGDPYHCECLKTARLLAEALQLEKEQYDVCFQSRFGKAEWLQPYLSTTLEKLGKAGTKRVDVVCPGFVADCLETLEEVAMEGKATFLAAGGKEFHYIPCLNTGAAWVDALADLVAIHLQGWLPEEEDEASRARARQRALALGARQ